MHPSEARRHLDHPVIPRAALIAMAALAVASIAVAAFGRYTGIGTTGTHAGRVISSVDLRFEDLPGGGVLVRAADGQALATLDPATNGFVRGALRSMVRDRKPLAIGSDIPFRIERRDNGRLMLSDPATGGRIALDAFGPSNAGAFARFLPDMERQP